MRTAESVLAVIRERGAQRKPLYDVYRQLFNPELYWVAYGKIARNRGAMTRGVTRETADGMSQHKIADLIDALRFERYRWTPVRRVHIAKKPGATKTRPLGIPTWSDKVLQEVIRLILEAYYEPQFSEHSHGFRPQRGCHTALLDIRNKWKGTVWFIEGDIKGCFDNIDHAVLLSILRENIHDNRFIRLIENLLRAGYLEQWTYHETLSGTPQGGIVSPVLANIYLDRLDRFMTDTIIPDMNRGRRRKPNPDYRHLLRGAGAARKRGDGKAASALMQAARKLPSHGDQDPNYRRLRYVRYADDFLIGYAGPRDEAEIVKRRLQTFLRQRLRLELSEEKTLITHARSQCARFLGYDVGILAMDDFLVRDKLGTRRRVLNGSPTLSVPWKVVEARVQRYQRDGKASRRVDRLNDSPYDIVTRYQTEYRGFAAYYALAFDRSLRLPKLKWVMEQSLTATLANKWKTSRKKVSRRLRASHTTERGTYKVLKVVVPREGREPLVAIWGGVSLARPQYLRDVQVADPTPLPINRTELVQRLLADTCEACGSTVNVEVHHIHKLADIRPKGRKAPPYWAQRMLARRRKTLVLCRSCHEDLHAGRLDGTPRERNTGEPDDAKVSCPVRRGAGGKVPA